MRLHTTLLGACSLVALTGVASAETLTIATVNNGDMIRMQKLTDDFTAQHPDIDLDWVTLEENVLRQRVTTDIATNSGQYDVLTIGNYEVPIWAKQDWLLALDGMPDDYDAGDLLPAIAGGLSVDDTLYAAPFYGESAMVMYRTDLAEKAGVTIPAEPKWDDIKKAAAAMTDKDNGITASACAARPAGARTWPLSPPCPIPMARAGSTWTGNRSSRAMSGRQRSPIIST